MLVRMIRFVILYQRS